MGVGVKYNLYICDINYNKLVLVDYIFLQYSEVINAIPQAYFVLQTQSPELKKIQFRPFEKVYTCIIERNGVEKFRGEIDRMATPKNNTPASLNLAEAYGTMDRVEFNASHFLQRASNLNVTGKEADGTVNNTYTRTFADNTKIGDAIRTLMTEAINIPGSPIADLVLGTIENPLNSSGAEITIGSEQSLYSTNYLYCLSLLAGIGYSDFYFTNTTTLYY